MFSLGKGFPKIKITVLLVIWDSIKTSFLILVLKNLHKIIIITLIIIILMDIILNKITICLKSLHKV